MSTRAGLLEDAARVFSRMTYAEARLKDVADESGISAGSMYFHFGNKADVAKAIFQVEQERMTVVLTEVLQRDLSGLDSLLTLIDELGRLIASDVVVQAGIKLSMQPGPDLEDEGKGPYFEWIEIAATLIRRGIEDGSITSTAEVSAAAEYVNVVFVGAQVLSELQDSWTSLPARLQRLRPHLARFLGGEAAS